MPDTPSITIVKSFDYRGAPERWTNKYHFSGTVPGNSADWKALAQAIWNQERTFLNGAVKLVGALGYNAGNEASVWQYDFTTIPAESTAGQISVGTNTPGDVAAWVRWTTGLRNSKGKPIYGRKYFHGIQINPPDTIHPTVKAAMQAYATKMVDGSLLGNFKVCGPQGAVYTNGLAPSFVTTRTLKRSQRSPA